MILVDAHVHLHNCFSPERFLDAAARHMATAAQDLGLPALTPGMLLFTHSRDDDAFGGLRSGPVGHWTLEATPESTSLVARRAEQPPLMLVAGRQIATIEGLEVLALGAPGPFADVKPVEKIIDLVRAQDGIPVIPWGFGKWWWRRGKAVRRLAADRARFPLLFLGDNAGRPGIAPRPRLFAIAERHDRAVLPGTDPLPVPGEENKVGRLVFRAECKLDVDKPFAGLKDWLTQCGASPAAYGAYEGTLTFIRRQIEMQLRKRLPAM